MVQHGRNKKRRAGRIGKTKLKNRSWNRWNPNPKVGNPTLKRLWDPSKSPAANLAGLGLVADPNGTSTNKSKNSKAENDDTTKKPSCPAELVELFDVPDSDTLSQKRQRRHPMTAEEEAYMAKCFAKYGVHDDNNNNYTKMFRDTQGVNTLQHTEEKLRKLGARYLLLTPEQRRQEVPDTVKEWMAAAQQQS